MSDSTGIKTRVRWVTWWPIGYWFARFEELARRPEIDFEVVFLSKSSQHYDEFSLDGLQFEYKILSSESSGSAFYRPAFELRNPLALSSDTDRLIVHCAHWADSETDICVVRRLKKQPYHLFVANTFKDARPSSYVNEVAKRFIFQGAAGYFFLPAHFKSTMLVITARQANQ